MSRPRLSRAARWSAIATAVLVLGSVVAMMLPAGETDDHAALGVKPAELAVALVTVPILFGICFLVSLALLKSREG